MDITHLQELFKKDYPDWEKELKGYGYKIQIVTITYNNAHIHKMLEKFKVTEDYFVNEICMPQESKEKEKEFQDLYDKMIEYKNSLDAKIKLKDTYKYFARDSKGTVKYFDISEESLKLIFEKVGG